VLSQARRVSVSVLSLVAPFVVLLPDGMIVEPKVASGCNRYPRFPAAFDPISQGESSSSIGYNE
jgi:hypothetical protein